MRLLTPGDIRELAGRLGVRPSKRLGQNFVVEPGTVRRIAALAALEPQDVVLEVGPGLGSLTLALLEAGAGRVVGVEIDPVLAAELPRTIAARAPGLADRAAVVAADALRIEGRDLPAAPSVLVANLPYNVAVPVLLHLLAALPSLRRGLVMVQAEVADRMCAAAGITGVRHAVGEAGLVRRGPPGRPGAAQRVLAGAERGFPAGRVHPAGSAGYRGEPRGGVRGRRRGLPAAAQDAARRAVRLGRLGAGGRTAAPGGRPRPGRPRRIARCRGVRAAGGVAPLNTTGRTAYDLTIVTGVTVRVPAKLNLQLAVGPPRADGYHDLVTVFHAVSLFDEITAEPARRDGVSVSGEGADRVPADGDNLALRAVAALRAEVPSAPGVHITIAKRIPVAAGLAGGSGDAAAALVACNELWAGGFGPPQLAEIAARVGSDVAFALLGGTAVGRGRGEQLTPALAPATQYHWVLAFADGHLSTPEVYAALDRQRARAGEQVPAGPGAGPRAHVGAALGRCPAGRPGAEQRPAAGRAVAVPGAAQDPGRRAGTGRARRAGVRLGTDLRVPGRQRGPRPRPGRVAVRRGRVPVGGPGQRAGARRRHRLRREVTGPR